MSTKHTPGPWIGRDDSGKYNSNHEWSAEHESASSTTFAPIWARGEVVALVVSASNKWSFDDTELNANARLIASAPDLLEALETMLKHPGTITAQLVAKAAIAKAAGTTP